MTIHVIKPNESFEVNVTVKSTDEYSKKIYVKFEHHLVQNELRGCNELLLTPGELKQLGQFFIEQAYEHYSK